MIMDKTVRLAKDAGVLVGAHPSLPDRQGFGRREMVMEPVRTETKLFKAYILLICSAQEELAACFTYQVGALTGFLTKHNMELNHVPLPAHYTAA